MYFTKNIPNAVYKNYASEVFYFSSHWTHWKLNFFMSLVTTLTLYLQNSFIYTQINGLVSGSDLNLEPKILPNFGNNLLINVFTD